MAKRRKRNKTELTSLIIVLLVVAISLLFKNASDKKQELETYVAVSDKEAVVHVINVGQGSSALIQCGKNGILIDAGEAEYGSMVANYIKASGVTQLSYVIASHPHSDHIGGLSRVLNSIPVKHVILPYITDENVPATASYERLLETIDRKNIDCTFWEYGDKNVFGIENVTLKILAPVGQTESLNNMSLICRVVAFGTSFLFPGDAENAELKDMMMKSPDISSDVMIMSHHGSSTSLYTPFLDASGFGTAVISCGEDNSYGHPHREILSYLKKSKAKVFRTDKQGTIKFTCDASGFTVTTEK